MDLDITQAILGERCGELYYQQKWLLRLQHFSPGDIWVARNRGPKDVTPGKWVKLLWYPFFKYGLVDYRTVLQNEIMIEMDFEKWANQRFWGKRIQKFLNEKNIPHLMYHSGGKGIHFSIFFSIDGLEALTGWRGVRVALWHYILNCCDVPKSLRGVDRPFDITAVSFGDTSQGHLIREIGGKKRQRKRIITKIPHDNIILTGDIVYPKKIPVWKVPIKLLARLNIERKPYLTTECNKCRIPIPSEFMPIFLDDDTEDYPFWVGCYICRFGRKI